MVHPIQIHLFIDRSTTPVFNEGAAFTISKVNPFVVELFAILASFILLPVQGALMFSIGSLISMLQSPPNNERVVVDVMEVQPRRWYQPVVDIFHRFFPRNVVSVVNPEPIAPVEERIQPHLGVNPRPVYPVPYQVDNVRNVAPVVGHQPRQNVFIPGLLFLSQHNQPQ